MKNDKMFLDNKLAIHFIAFIEDNLPDISDNSKTHLLIKMLRKYESEQTFKKSFGSQKMITGNTEEEVKNWLADSENTEAFVQRIYRDKCSMPELALKIYQIMCEQETIVQIHKPEFRITLSRMMIWQNVNTPEFNEINEDFCNFIKNNYPVLAEKLFDIPDIQEISKSNFYCRIIAQFGIKYYTDDFADFSEYEKIRITAEWLSDCKPMRDMFWDLYEGFIIDESEYYDRFEEMWEDEDSLPPAPEKDILLYNLIINLPSMKAVMKKIAEKEGKKLQKQIEEEFEKQNKSTSEEISENNNSENI